MITTLLDDLKSHRNIRQNLSALRQELKDPTALSTLRRKLQWEDDFIPILISFLNNKDAKTRKNAALLMGDLGLEEFLTPLFQGYQSEVQRFVRSAYLLALQSFDCRPYLAELKEQIQVLSQADVTFENQKHIGEELRALSQLVILEEGITTHTFTGNHHPLDCILLTNRNYKELTESQITSGEFIPFLAGVRVLTEDIQSLLDIRTYSELLLVIPGLDPVSSDPVTAATAIAQSQLLPMLQQTHQETTPFYFRLEMKSKMPLDEKTAFAKKFCSELERLSNRQLLNSTSNYELELRLIENKLGTFSVLLKLGTLQDKRFAYRKESVAASIRPSSAAQLVALAQDYMVADARTLDPFCGVGTMLIERQMVVKGNTSYGIDFYAPAIEKARINTEAAGQIVHYINRNFFDFTHEYVFDEILTNMPFATGHKSEEEIAELYEEFFLKAQEVLTSDGTIIMYSHNPELVRELSLQHPYHILESWEIVKKENTWLFVIRFEK